MAVLLGNFREN